MIFGTFDGVHPGHLDFFKQARKLAGKTPEAYLVVSIARDKNVKKIKGEQPHFHEKERKALVEKTGLVDRVVLSGIKNYLPHIFKEKPQIIGLGYDQSAYVENLKRDLLTAGLDTKVVRLKPYKEHIYKNKLLKQKLRA